MGVERRTVEKIQTEEVEEHICDGCGNVRKRDENGYFSILDKWGYLHWPGREKPVVVLCKSCVKIARHAVGWK